MPGLIVVDVIGEHSQPYAELRRGQTHAGRVEHRVGRIRYEGAKFLVEGFHPLSRGPEDGISEQTDWLDGHRTSLEITQNNSIGSSTMRTGSAAFRADRRPAARCSAEASAAPDSRATRINIRWEPPSDSPSIAPMATGPINSCGSGSAVSWIRSVSAADGPV